MDEDVRLRGVGPCGRGGSAGSWSLTLKPVLFIHYQRLVTHQTPTSDLHPHPAPPPIPQDSSLHLDELGPWAQLPLGSAEVEQDDRSAALGQAGTQAKAQVACSSGDHNLLP